MPKPPTDRDLTVYVLALVVAGVVGTLETLIDLQPNSQNGLLDAALIFGAVLAFYNIGKGSAG